MIVSPVPPLPGMQLPQCGCPFQAGSTGCRSCGCPVPPLHGCSVCGKGFQETIDQMKPRNASKYSNTLDMPAQLRDKLELLSLEPRQTN